MTDMFIMIGEVYIPVLSIAGIMGLVIQWFTNAFFGRY